MVQYATADELAALLQVPVDATRMDPALQRASARFDREARTTFAPTSATFTDTPRGVPRMRPPRRPLVSVESVTINGGSPLVAGTDYELVDGVLYRSCGWGDACVFPPDEVVVDYTYGYATVPDDVKDEVLGYATQRITNPTRAEALAIDDFRASYGTSQSGTALPPSFVALARKFRRGASSVGPDTPVLPAVRLSDEYRTAAGYSADYGSPYQVWP